MVIVVLNGSPKGERSITLQYVRYLQKLHPEHSFELLPVAAQAGVYERDPEKLEPVLQALARADLVLWAFPLYYLLVCSQYKRFVELLFARGAREILEGRYTAAISTSIHFFDHTAHDYIQAVSEDLGLRYLGFYSAAMNDLAEKNERARLRLWAEDLFAGVETGRPTAPRFAPIPPENPPYTAVTPKRNIESRGRKVLILSDCTEASPNQRRMVERALAACPGAEHINLHETRTLGPCMGCCRCGYDNTCSYDGKDDFIPFYREKVMKADVVVFCGRVVDRNLSSTWRRYFDRCFVEGHKPSLAGKQVIFLISGPSLPELRAVYDGWADVQQVNVVGWIHDDQPGPRIDALIDDHLARALLLGERGYLRPRTFLSVGGQKLFRDEIWGHLRPVFQADHRAYKKLGWYDFPQRTWATNLVTSFLYWLLHVPAVRRYFMKVMPEQMVAPYRKIVDEAVALSHE